MNKNTVRQAGGFIIQLMPGRLMQVIDALENKIKEIHLLPRFWMWEIRRR